MWHYINTRHWFMGVIFSNINFPLKSLMVARAQSSKKGGLEEFRFIWVKPSFSTDPSLMTDCTPHMSGKDELLSVVVWIWNPPTGSCIKHTVSTWKLCFEKYRRFKRWPGWKKWVTSSGLLKVVPASGSSSVLPTSWVTAMWRSLSFCYWYHKNLLSLIQGT